MKKPQVSSAHAQKELDKAEAQFDKFNEDVKALTQDRMNAAPKEEVEPQTKMSAKEVDKDTIWLKPVRKISSKEPFNEKFRKAFEFAKEHVKFIAEHKEIIGETIEIWTKEFAGQDAEYWEVPTNKPVSGPRYLAERIKKAKYHRLIAQNATTHSSGGHTFYGSLAVDKAVQRLDAYPVNETKSIFMGASNF